MEGKIDMAARRQVTNKLRDADILTSDQIAEVDARIRGVNPADLTRQINHVQTELATIARSKTEALSAGQALDMESLQPSINRLTATNRKRSHAQKA